MEMRLYLVLLNPNIHPLIKLHHESSFCLVYQGNFLNKGCLFLVDLSLSVCGVTVQLTYTVDISANIC